MDIHKRIKELRLRHQLTLSQLAKLLGVEEATVQRYESGVIKNIKYETINKLCEIFNCTPSYLMGWDEIIEQHTIGDRIKQLRITKGYTLENLSKITSIPKEDLIFLENNERYEIPTEDLYKYMEQIATFFDVDEDFLWMHTNEYDKIAANEERTFLQYLTKHDLHSHYVVEEKEFLILTNYRKLNYIGKQRAEEYMVDLTEQEKYTKRSEE